MSTCKDDNSPVHKRLHEVFGELETSTKRFHKALNAFDALADKFEDSHSHIPEEHLTLNV